MGSLTSRPKIPQQIAQTSAQPAVSGRPLSISAAEVGSRPAQDLSKGTNIAAQSDLAQVVEPSQEDMSARRTQSLLRRNRGRLGTIQTGFRGLFSNNAPENLRKTLLGE